MPCRAQSATSPINIGSEEMTGSRSPVVSDELRNTAGLKRSPVQWPTTFDLHRPAVPPEDPSAPTGDVEEEDDTAAGPGEVEHKELQG